MHVAEKLEKKMHQITPFLINLKTKFERPSFGLTSHNTQMYSVVLTHVNLKLCNSETKSPFCEILNINSTDVALYISISRY